MNEIIDDIRLTHPEWSKDLLEMLINIIKDGRTEQAKEMHPNATNAILERMPNGSN